MKPRHVANPPRLINPLMVVAAKTNVPQDFADHISMIVLVALDAAKRGAANNALANTLTLHLATAQILWAEMRNRPMYDRAVTGWQAMCKACQRDPDRSLSLTTGEYASIRIAVGYYLRSLPKLEAGRLVSANQQAQIKLGETVP